MKVAELTGMELDRWAASADPMCAGCIVEYVSDERGAHYVGRCDEGVAFFIPPDGAFQRIRLKRKYPGADEYSPSRNWADAGRLIERERIAIEPVAPGVWSAEKWTGAEGTREDRFVTHNGAIALEAAIRVFVAAKLGEEVTPNA